MKSLVVIFLIKIIFLFGIGAVFAQSSVHPSIGKKLCKLAAVGNCPDFVIEGLPETIGECKSCCSINTAKLPKSQKAKCIKRCTKACDERAASLGLDPTAVSREQNK